MGYDESVSPLFRAHPVIGFFGGLLVAVNLHFLGVPAGLLHDPLTALFKTAPLVGYVVFALIGTCVALIYRRLGIPSY